MALLHGRTEGWAAGLYLAALSLKGRPDAGTFIRAFAGDHRHIVDYLSAEVLDGQPPDLRTFLLRTSVLGRLSGPLCDAVLQSQMSAAILKRIERDNLFLTPLDSSRHWYRYHHLFGELLRSELQRTEPGLVPALHQRAAAWFQDEGATDDAVHHLAAAGDVPATTELIAASWGAEYDLGHLDTVSGWLDLLPEPDRFRGSPPLPGPGLDRPRPGPAPGRRPLDRGRGGGTRRWPRRGRDHRGRTGRPPGRSAFQDRRRRRGGPRRHAGHPPGSQATRARAVPPPTASTGPPTTGLAASRRHGPPCAGPRSWLMRRAITPGRTYALGYLAVISAERGQLAEAEHLIHRATSDRDAAVGEHFVDMMVSLATAKVLSERGETARAGEAAHRAVVLSQRGAGRLEMADALLAQARILQDLGDQETAGTSRGRSPDDFAAVPGSRGGRAAARQRGAPAGSRDTAAPGPGRVRRGTHRQGSRSPPASGHALVAGRDRRATVCLGQHGEDPPARPVPQAPGRRTGPRR